MKDTSHFSRRVLLRQFSRSAAAAACLPLLNLAERGHGAPPPKDVPARVSLDPSGLITSPAGDLTDGVNRVECTFNPNGGDLRLNTYHAAAFNLAAELSGQIVPGGAHLRHLVCQHREPALHHVWLLDQYRGDVLEPIAGPVSPGDPSRLLLDTRSGAVPGRQQLGSSGNEQRNSCPGAAGQDWVRPGSLFSSAVPYDRHRTVRGRT
jgi:hypothetical protein